MKSLRLCATQIIVRIGGQLNKLLSGRVFAAILRSAILCAGVHQLILNLPNGYDTQIGPGGVTLSAGQRQRIALARALYGDPAFLVLDEPNSNLDTEGDNALTKAMIEVKAKHQTTVVITHRMNILSQVDYIMALNQGVIEKFGTREQILSQFMRAVSTAVAKP